MPKTTMNRSMNDRKSLMFCRLATPSWVKPSSTAMPLGMITYPVTTPARNSGVAVPMKIRAHFFSLASRPGTMKAQSW